MIQILWQHQTSVIRFNRNNEVCRYQHAKLCPVFLGPCGWAQANNLRCVYSIFLFHQRSSIIATVSVRVSFTTILVNIEFVTMEMSTLSLMVAIDEYLWREGGEVRRYWTNNLKSIA